MKILKASILSLALLISGVFIPGANSAQTSSALPYYTNLSDQPIDLLSQFPEKPVLSKIDERLVQTVVNNISQPGLLLRSLNSVFFPTISSSLVGTTPGAGGATYCSNFDDPGCASLTNLSYQISLTPCMTPTQTDCISKFLAERPDGKIEEATPLAPINSNANTMKVTGDAARNIPSGGIPYVWTFPNLQHRGGKLFIPQVTLINYGNQVNTTTRSTFKFEEPEFKIAINPVSPGSSSGNILGSVNQGSYSLLPDTFLDESSFTLEFRTSLPWRTWSRSTITDFELSSSQVGNSYMYILKGKPAKVPVIAEIIPWTQGNIDTLRAIDLGGVSVAQQCDNNSKSDPYKCWVALDIGGGKANFDTYFNWFKIAEPYSDSKSTLAPTRWVIESVPAFNKLYGSSIFGEGTEGVPCVRDYGLTSPMGVTSSNATLATDGPPTWDKSTASLNYKVAAMHYLPNGEEFAGHYTLQIPRKLAECLWGKDASKSKAVVSILNSDGSSQVITATTGVTNSYFKFNVAGFHFSSPRISISLKEDTSVSTPSPSTSTSASRKSITCIKGKLTKTVTGLKPICPKGYKKK